MNKWVIAFVIIVLMVIFGLTGGCVTQGGIAPQGHVRYIDIDQTVDYVQLMVIQPREVAGKANLVTTPQAICAAFADSDFARADVVEAQCADVRCEQMVIMYQCRTLYGF